MLADKSIQTPPKVCSDGPSSTSPRGTLNLISNAEPNSNKMSKDVRPLLSFQLTIRPCLLETELPVTSQEAAWAWGLVLAPPRSAVAAGGTTPKDADGPSFARQQIKLHASRCACHASSTRSHAGESETKGRCGHSGRCFAKLNGQSGQGPNLHLML